MSSKALPFKDPTPKKRTSTLKKRGTELTPCLSNYPDSTPSMGVSTAVSGSLSKAGKREHPGNKHSQSRDSVSLFALSEQKLKKPT